jgi:hypothetical protein
VEQVKKLRWKWQDFKELVLPSYVCKVLGHKEPFKKKFGGELLCARCSRQVGRWSA